MKVRIEIIRTISQSCEVSVDVCGPDYDEEEAYYAVLRGEYTDEIVTGEETMDVEMGALLYEEEVAS